MDGSDVVAEEEIPMAVNLQTPVALRNDLRA